MTTFDKREEGFEKKFAIDEEQRFKAEARRNKLLGLWAASQLGMSGEAASAYAKEVVFRKVKADFDAKGITFIEAELRAKMNEFMAQAIVQVKAGE
jgi:hypothetical protein